MQLFELQVGQNHHFWFVWRTQSNKQQKQSACFHELLLVMPPKAAKQATRWGQEHREAILYGFRNLGWDPTETRGATINKLLKTLPKKELDLISPHFSKGSGGTKADNNTLYGHFKNLGCEFIVERTRAGFRRTDGAFGLALFPGTPRSTITHWLLFHSFQLNSLQIKNSPVLVSAQVNDPLRKTRRTIRTAAASSATVVTRTDRFHLDRKTHHPR